MIHKIIFTFNRELWNNSNRVSRSVFFDDIFDKWKKYISTVRRIILPVVIMIPHKINSFSILLFNEIDAVRLEVEFCFPSKVGKLLLTNWKLKFYVTWIICVRVIIPYTSQPGIWRGKLGIKPGIIRVLTWSRLPELCFFWSLNAE